MELGENILNLYIHEIALHVDHNVDEYIPIFSAENLQASRMEGPPMSKAQLEALTTCLNAIHGAFDAFLSLGVEFARTIPLFHFVRVSYAAVALVKIWIMAASPGSEFGKVIKSLDDLRVEEYLTRITDFLKESAANGVPHQGTRFSSTLVMLRSWFQKNGKQIARAAQAAKDQARRAPSSNSAAKPSAAPPPQAPASGPPATQPYLPSQGPTHLPPTQQPQAQAQMLPNSGVQQPTNTPLHLLSEVAMSGNQQGPSPTDPQAQAQAWFPNNQQAWQQAYQNGWQGPTSQMYGGAVDVNSLFMDEGFYNLTMQVAPNLFYEWGGSA